MIFITITYFLIVSLYPEIDRMNMESINDVKPALSKFMYLYILLMISTLK